MVACTALVCIATHPGLVGGVVVAPQTLATTPRDMATMEIMWITHVTGTKVKSSWGFPGLLIIAIRMSCMSDLMVIMIHNHYMMIQDTISERYVVLKFG